MCNKSGSDALCVTRDITTRKERELNTKEMMRELQAGEEGLAKQQAEYEARTEGLSALALHEASLPPAEPQIAHRAAQSRRDAPRTGRRHRQ